MNNTPIPATEEVSIASSVVPYPWDDSRATYLACRACGLSVRESLNALQLSIHTLNKWRRNPDFKYHEERVPEYRSTLSKEYLSILTHRNYLLVMQRDYNIIVKALQVDAGESPFLSKQEQQYLLSMRRNYNPQQLEMLEALVQGKRDGGNGGGFNWAEAVSQLSQTGKSVEVSRTDTIKVNNPIMDRLEELKEDNGSIN